MTSLSIVPIFGGKDQRGLPEDRTGLGKKSEAIACLDRALALDPDYSPELDNRPILEHMLEGEPFVAGKMLEVEHYREALERA